MDETQIKFVIEAALLAAGRPLTLDKLVELFAGKGEPPDRAVLRHAIDALALEYEGRGIEIKEVSSGFRVQVRRSMSDWLQPLWEERAPRYTRALLETLALIAYRQPITRAEIEEVRGVVVSTNIIRTLLERNWIRVVGHRDVPGKPSMFGTTKDFLDYFGLNKLEDLPPLAELKDAFPEVSPQTDLVETIQTDANDADATVAAVPVAANDAESPDSLLANDANDASEEEPEDEGEEELAGADIDDSGADNDAITSDSTSAESVSAEIIPLRAVTGTDED